MAAQRSAYCWLERSQTKIRKKKQADYSQLLQGMLMSNPEGATNFAKALLEGSNGQPLIDINAVVKTFMEQNKLQETI